MTIEDGYRNLQSKAQMLYEIIYAFNKIPFFSYLTCSIVSRSTISPLEYKILSEKPEKIVVFHFFLLKPIYKIVEKHKLKCRIITVVTDPYTPHPIWFLRKKQNFVVFSEKLKKKIDAMNLEPESIEVFPFILDEKFDKPMNEIEISSLKQKMGFDKSRKVVLIIGGADGLVKGEVILKKLLAKIKDHYIVMVCGKNEELYKLAVKIQKSGNYPYLKLFRLIDFVNDMLNISDVVITKCGASTFMEILLTRKVPVVTNYIWEQEKGNMEYLRDNGLGIYEKRLRKISDVVNELITNDQYYSTFVKKIINQDLKNGTAKVADYIYNI